MFFTKRPEFVSFELLSRLDRPPRVATPCYDDTYLNDVFEGRHRPLRFSIATQWLPAARILLSRVSNSTLYDWANDPEFSATSEPDPTPPNGGEKVKSPMHIPNSMDSEISGTIYRSTIREAA